MTTYVPGHGEESAAEALGYPPEAHERSDQDDERANQRPEDEPTVQLSCDCEWSWHGPEGAVEWITDRHAHAHNKGAWVPGKEGQERLPATGRMEIRRCATEGEARPQVEAEAER